MKWQCNKPEGADFLEIEHEDDLEESHDRNEWTEEECTPKYHLFVADIQYFFCYVELCYTCDRSQDKTYFIITWGIKSNHN